MFQFLAFVAALPITLGFYNAFQDNADLTQIATNISTVVNTPTGHTFELGGGRTFSQALDSCTFAYDSCQKF